MSGRNRSTRVRFLAGANRVDIALQPAGHARRVLLDQKKTVPAGSAGAVGKVTCVP
jgi:hypothetical protein